eukprot:TRINITY_DN29220_c0_g1_i2.p1 TRINITY_DN29220_c0_g1~~TRINITY_DN29220_c0_g1_i2.p1  ORF type:complete len:398 (+),score=53.37 TRINITY_DN29220_c0_g1_i2:229-1422(+)
MDSQQWWHCSQRPPKKFHPSRGTRNRRSSIMLEADKFPMLDPLVAERCRWMGPNDVEESKLSAGIALEAKQGNSSKFHSYLKILPKLADFRSYHPLFMTGSLLQEFQDLPLTRHASAQATKLQKLQGCFDDWRASALSPVASLRWEDFLWASLVQLTRHYRMHGARAMMPAIDSINTAAKGRWNVAVQPKYFSDVEEVKLGPGGLRAGAEALIPFCDSCDNSQMLLQWGIYLEDNSVLIQDLFEAPKANCSRSLQEVTIASLDVSASTAEAARLAGWAAPRCRQDLMSAIEDQGPLRCSLARLAWERCSEAWGQRGWRGLAPHWQQRCQQAAALMSYLVPGSAAARFILYGTLFLLPYGLFFFAILRRGAARTIAAKESQRKKRGGNAMDQPSTLPA